jgi:hypothetical protein
MELVSRRGVLILRILLNENPSCDAIGYLLMSNPTEFLLTFYHFQANPFDARTLNIEKNSLSVEQDGSYVTNR